MWLCIAGIMECQMKEEKKCGTFKIENTVPNVWWKRGTNWSSRTTKVVCTEKQIDKEINRWIMAMKFIFNTKIIKNTESWFWVFFIKLLN